MGNSAANLAAFLFHGVRIAVATYLIPRLQTPFDTAVNLPGSKSIALRQLAMAALVEATTTVTGVPPCDDVDAMLDCLAALGVQVATTGTTVELRGPLRREGDVSLNARMSGASTRLLIGLAALRRGRTTLDGHPSLRRRTNAPLYEALTRCGCRVEGTDEGLPVTIQGPMQVHDEIVIDGSLSSQYISAILLIAPYLKNEGATRIRITGDLVSAPYVNITLNEMAKRGISASWPAENLLEVPAGSYRDGRIAVEGDATAATYFTALATLHGSRVRLTNLGGSSRQGDTGFNAVMEALGAQVTVTAHETEVAGPVALDDLPSIDMTAMPDAALTLIAMAPMIPGDTLITGLQSLHHKECDRLTCPATEFAAWGVAAETTHDTIRLPQAHDVAALPAYTMNTYHDHRMAMAFSLPGSLSGRLSVDEKTVVGKTYPAFWQDYEALGS